MTFAQFIGSGNTGIIGILNTVAVPIIFALSFAAFVWGVLNYFFLNGGNENRNYNAVQIVDGGGEEDQRQHPPAHAGHGQGRHYPILQMRSVPRSDEVSRARRAGSEDTRPHVLSRSHSPRVPGLSSARSAGGVAPWLRYWKRRIN